MFQDYRLKPTKHKQRCAYCSEQMIKGEEQIVLTRVEPNGWSFSDYFHVGCRFRQLLRYPDFRNHYKKRYRRPFDADGFHEVWKSDKWREWTAWYIRQPFELLNRLSDDKPNFNGKKFLDDCFNELVWEETFEGKGNR